MGFPRDVWERVGLKVRKKDQAGQIGAEPRDPCKFEMDAGVLEALVLQAGRAECGTPFQLFQGWDTVQELQVV